MTDVQTPSSAACPRSRDDYTIGWISALSVEFAAASVMLDEKHEQIPVAEGDDNAYTLGRVGLHHIVIALINEAGGLPAHVVATNMMKSFGNIRYVLMVGIGGGIPSDEYQIRLGDVVVSKPKDRSPGVVQSDFGKWEEDGSKVKGALNLPAAGLMRVVGKVEAQSLLGEVQEGDIHTSVKHLRRGAFKKMAPWKYQGRNQDPLYKEDPEPREDVVCDECESQPNSHCPDPEVHYGVIASGNYVVKSRSQRDRLRQEFGACCVEMEAFGLMSHFPCLVIRGISDYADGEKNDKWQPYSALTAAAYAKALLLQLSVEDIRSTGNLSEQLKHVDQRLDEIQDNLNAVRIRGEEQTGEKIFKWLSCLTPWKTHGNIHKSCVEGTSKSLQEAFSKWISDEPESLMLVGLGNPGAGKTVAMSVLIDHIHQLTKESKAVFREGYAYVYLEFKDRAQQTRESIIGAITRQLLNDLPEIPTPIRTMWEKCRPREAPIGKHIEMLCEVCKTFTIAYICIDALDECDNLSDLLNTLKKVIEAVPSVRLICTGRPTIKASIENMNVHSTWMCVTACGYDVRALIERRIEECEDKIGFDEQKEITESLLKKYDNIFLLPVLHIRLVLGQPTKKMRWKTLNTLQPSLEGTFRQTLKRIEESGKQRFDIAKNILTWVHLAMRPLSFEELRHALAIEEDESDLDPDNLMSRDFIVRCCLGLVIIETDSSPVRLCHLGLHNYFDEKQAVGGHTFSEGHNILACACLRYMLGESLIRKAIPKALYAFLQPALENDYHFFHYSTCFWSSHVRGSGQHDQAVELTVRYLSLDAQRQSIRHLKHGKSASRKSQCDTSVQVPSYSVNEAVYLGLEKVVRALLQRTSMQIESTDCQDRMSHSNVEATRHGQIFHPYPGDDHMDINSRDGVNGLTLLHKASKLGHHLVVKELLQSDADCLTRDFDGRTSLHYAVISRRISTIEVLANHNNGQLLNIQDDFGLTALHLAVRLDPIDKKRTFNMVRLLRTKGARTDVCSFSNTSPIDEARKLSLEPAVNLLQHTNGYAEPQADTPCVPSTSIGYENSLMAQLYARETLETLERYPFTIESRSHDFQELTAMAESDIRLIIRSMRPKYDPVVASMCSQLKTYIEDHVREINNAARRKTGKDLLSFYIRQWNKYVKSARRSSENFRYLNEDWMEMRRKEGKLEFVSFFEFHLICWRDLFFMGVYSRLREVLCAREQTGELLYVEQIRKEDVAKTSFDKYRFRQLTFLEPG